VAKLRIGTMTPVSTKTDLTANIKTTPSAPSELVTQARQDATGGANAYCEWAGNGPSIYFDNSNKRSLHRPLPALAYFAFSPSISGASVNTGAPFVLKG